MKVRKSIRAIHRDIGYLCVGLIIIYSISGIAVNHINQWNPNYIIEDKAATITPFNDSSATNESIAQYVVNQLNEPGEITSFFRNSPTTIKIFMEQRTIDADLTTGKVNIETVKSRPVINEVNFLHLNKPKRIWTYVADAFAACLIILALTGMFILPNKKGFMGRGKYFVGAGILIPLIFYFIYL